MDTSIDGFFYWNRKTTQSFLFSSKNTTKHIKIKMSGARIEPGWISWGKNSEKNFTLRNCSLLKWKLFYIFLSHEIDSWYRKWKLILAFFGRWSLTNNISFQITWLNALTYFRAGAPLLRYPIWGHTVLVTICHLCHCPRVWEGIDSKTVSYSMATFPY